MNDAASDDPNSTVTATQAQPKPVDENWTRALCVLAHPDDLEFGTAGAIARWTGQGKRVDYALATSGEAGIDALAPEECGPLREAEERESARIVGVEQVEFLGFADGVLEYGLALRAAICATIRRYRPDIVITQNYAAYWSGGG